MQVESKIMEQVKSVLSDFGNKYIDNNGALKRNMVIEDLNHYDKDWNLKALNCKFQLWTFLVEVVLLLQQQWKWEEDLLL